MIKNMCKPAMLFNLCHSACKESVILIAEITEVCAFSICVYVCLPNLISTVPYHTGIPAFVVFVAPAILAILLASSYAKVVAPIVQCVAVTMIALYFWISQTENKTMHQWPIVRSPSIKRMSRYIPECVPIPTHQPFIVESINNGNVAICQRNKFDRLIERLDNRLALDSILGHDLTSNEMAVFNRISIVPSFAGGK